MNSARTKKIEIGIKEEEQIFNEQPKEATPVENEKPIDVPKESTVHKTIPLEVEGLGEQNLVNRAIDENDDYVQKPEKVKISKLLKDLPTNVKVMYYFLLIFTFGFFAKTIRSRIEENAENVIKTSTEIPFNMKIFMNALGEADNIQAVEATISSVKITFKNIEKVDKDKIKQLSKRGILVSDNKITILFGNYSQTLKEEIEKEMKK